MHRFAIQLAATLAVSLVCRGALAADAPNTLSQEEKEAGWKLLFDGKTTKGWRGYQRKDVPPGWKVIDGALVRVAGGAGGKGAGGGDDLVTLDEYQNFDLKLQWKIVKGANSGVLYRVIEDPPASWNLAPEMQVLDNGAYVGRDPRQLAGALYDLYPASKDVAKPADQWNDVRVLVDGNHVEHWLNGEKVVEYELNSDDWKSRVKNSKFKDMPQFAQAAKGYICLQDHSDKVEFRDIKVRVLPAKDKRP